MRSSPEMRAFVRPAAEAGNLGADPSPPGERTRSSSTAVDRLEGFREGRREGLELGVMEGRALGQESVASTLQALADAVSAFDERRDMTLAQIERLAVELAIELAEVIIGRELEAASNPGADALRRAMHLRAEHEPVRARLHPDDAAMITAGLAADVSVVADPTVNRGDALVELGDGLVDASISAALARVKAAFE